MVADALNAVAVLGSGTVAGVFFAVAVSVMPALAGLEPGPYLRIHQDLGKGYHPAMPIIASAAVVADAGLIGTAGDGVRRGLAVAALVALLGVQAVSHLRNERVNRRVRAIDPRSVPTGWEDPREAWRRWHLVRTGLAVAAFLMTVAATVAR